jgi:xanthine dehydrogenase YagT iron-sulfur-binding subunit
LSPSVGPRIASVFLRSTSMSILLEGFPETLACNEVETATDVTRREFVGAAALGLTISTTASGSPPHASESYTLTINGKKHEFAFDPRVTLLDLLRERLHLTGTKKGCDHGQCGACTVLVNGVRINSCLTLAISQDGNQITTIEGIANGETLHPLQASFIEHDAFQCGFCTSGQICSGVAMLKEWDEGKPSSAAVRGNVALTDAEIRERMAGNICRCGAYPNIVAAIRAVHDSRG